MEILKETTCKICKESKADQTGSHLLSAFFIESMIGKRDDESSFLLTDKPNFEHRIDRKADPIKEDYIFCRGCEQRLSYLESYICQEFTKKNEKVEYKANFEVKATENGVRYKECKNVNPYAFSLLIYSIILRASISQKELYKHFNLSDNEILRVLLNDLLPEYKDHKVKIKQKNWLKELNKKSENHTWPEFIALRKETIENQDTSRNMVFLHPKLNDPYNLMLNEFIVLYSEKAPLKLNQDLFKISEKFKDWTQIISPSDILKIGIFDDREWNSLLLIVPKLLKTKKIEAMQINIINEFRIKFGRQPTSLELSFCVENYIRNENAKL